MANACSRTPASLRSVTALVGYCITPDHDSVVPAPNAVANEQNERDSKKEGEASKPFMRVDSGNLREGAKSAMFMSFEWWLTTSY